MPTLQKSKEMVNAALQRMLLCVPPPSATCPECSSCNPPPSMHPQSFARSLKGNVASASSVLYPRSSVRMSTRFGAVVVAEMEGSMSSVTPPQPSCRELHFRECSCGVRRPSICMEHVASPEFDPAYSVNASSAPTRTHVKMILTSTHFSSNPFSPIASY